MTISKALKKLYTAMCGGETNKTTAGDLISAIADDYTGGGGGGEYETVAEIAVGEMEYADGGYSNESSEFDVSEEISAGETYYFNSTANPSTSIIPEENAVLFNCEIGEGGYPVPIVPNKAWFYVVFESDHKTVVGSYDNSIENTTVKILKKVSGGGEGTAPLVVTLTPTETPGDYTVDVGASAVYEAYSAKRPVFSYIKGTGTSILPLLYATEDTEATGEQDKYTFGFCGTYGDNVLLVGGHVPAEDETIVHVSQSNQYIPTYGQAQAGCILKVNSSGTGLEWVLPT